MLTFFSIPKAFRGQAKIAQYNALESWTRLTDSIVLFGKEKHEPGIMKAAARFGCKVCGIRRDSEYGVPLVGSAFKRIQALRPGVAMFMNADMVFFPDLMEAVNIAKTGLLSGKPLGEFLLIGRKTDMDIRKPIEFSSGWEDRLRKRAQREGRLHGAAGLDFFIFTPGVYNYRDFPPFTIGRRAWDNWLAFHAMNRKDVTVVDVTESVLAIHHTNPKPKPATHPLIERNRRLAGEAGTWGRTIYAPVVMAGGKLSWR